MHKRIFLAAISIVFAYTGPAWAVDANAGYAKRSAVYAYATQCNLLNPAQLRAVRSGQLQARGALLRAGLSAINLTEMLNTAQQSVVDIACDNADALAEIETVRAAHTAWMVLQHLDYPATHRKWITSRNETLLKRRWRVSQIIDNQPGAIIQFGATSFQGKSSLDLLIENQSPPRSVLLRMRDPKKLENPPSRFLRKLLKLPVEGVAGLSPPDSATKTFFAAQRVVAEPALLSAEKGIRGVRFGFGQEGLDAFSNLDPREAISVDLYWSAGLGKPDIHKRLYVEVGDFMAARLFAEAKD